MKSRLRTASAVGGWLIAVAAVMALALIPAGATALNQPASRAAQLQVLLDSATKLDATAWSLKRSGNLPGCHLAAAADHQVGLLYTWRLKGEILDTLAC